MAVARIQIWTDRRTSLHAALPLTARHLAAIGGVSESATGSGDRIDDIA
jgi:hypothetical protein